MTVTTEAAVPGADFAVASDGIWYPERVAATVEPVTVGYLGYVVEPTRGGATGQAGIWLGPLEGATTRVSQDQPSTNLAFGSSAGGQVLGYAVSGAETSTVVLRSLDSGDERRHEIAGAAEAVAWMADGALLVLLAEAGADTASLSSGKPLAARGPLARSNRRPVGWRRLWRLDPSSGAVAVVSPAGLSVWEFASLPAGRIVAITSSDPSEAGWYRSALTVLGPGPDEWRTVHTASWPISSLTVSPDGAAVAFLEGWTSDRGLGTGTVRVADLASGTVTELVEPAGVDVTWLQWSADGRLWFAGWQGLGTAWGWIDAPLTAAPRATARHESADVITSRWHPQVVPLTGNRALAVRSTVAEPPEVCLLSMDGTAANHSGLNADATRSRDFIVQEVRWSVDGVELEGLLALPRDACGPVPLVVDIHGGPSVTYHHSWDVTWAETLTSQGYGLFLPNPFGGPGRGQSFARQNLGDPAGVEFAQILAGVRHLAAAGTVDLDRVAAMGASYGGYLTAWAVATGELFRGGIVIAGISNLQSCWGTANNGPFYEFLCLGEPRDQRELYAGRSPVNAVSPASLPTLVLHGELDQCVPVSQAHELFATMTAVGVACELVVYPGEGHQTQRIDHVRDQRRRIVGFLAELLS